MLLWATRARDDFVPVCDEKTLRIYGRSPTTKFSFIFSFMVMTLPSTKIKKFMQCSPLPHILHFLGQLTFNHASLQLASVYLPHTGSSLHQVSMGTSDIYVNRTSEKCLIIFGPVITEEYFAPYSKAREYQLTFSCLKLTSLD